MYIKKLNKFRGLWGAAGMISDCFYEESIRPVIFPLPLTLIRLLSILFQMAPAACNFDSSAVDQLPVAQVEIVTYEYKNSSLL